MQKSPKGKRSRYQRWQKAINGQKRRQRYEASDAIPASAEERKLHQVGETKSIGDRTYRLNNSHRWERVGKDQPKPPKANAGSQPHPAGFTTSRGSTYSWNGTTRNSQRNKSLHAEHGEHDVGLKEASQKTIFIDRDAAHKVDQHIQAGKDTPGAKSAFKPDKANGRVLLELHHADGRVEQRGEIPYSQQPEVGAHPLEFFNDGVHLGNDITELHDHSPLEDASESIQPGDVDRAQQSINADHKQRAAFVGSRLDSVQHRGLSGIMRAM